MILTLYYIIPILIAISAVIILFKTIFLEKVLTSNGFLNLSFMFILVTSLVSTLISISHLYAAENAYNILIRKASEPLSTIDMSTIKFSAMQPKAFLFWGLAISLIALSLVLKKYMIKRKLESKPTRPGTWDLNKYKEKK